MIFDCFTEINMEEKIDIISHVPTLVLEHIILYIDITSIAQCLKVSKRWKEIFHNLKIESRLQANWMCGKTKLDLRKGFSKL